MLFRSAEDEIDLQATHANLMKTEGTIRAATIKHNAFLLELNLPALPGGDAKD